MRQKSCKMVYLDGKPADIFLSARGCIAWTRSPRFKHSTGCDPVLPMSPGRAERHGFEYFRHRTLSLYAALDVKTGKVHGKTAARHTSDEFVAFLQQVISQCKCKQRSTSFWTIYPRTKLEGGRVSSTASKRKIAFHSHLFFLAKSSRDLVRPH